MAWRLGLERDNAAERDALVVSGENHPRQPTLNGAGCTVQNVSNPKMHPDEVDIDDELVRSLIRAQFPRYVGLPVSRVESAGTDNAMFRLGSDLVVRLPRIQRAESQVHTEQQWLPLLAAELPLPIPAPVEHGVPGPGFDMHWSIYRWLEGANAVDEPIVDLEHAAVELAHFGNAIRQVDATGGPPSFRGAPLANQEADVLAAIRDLGATGVIDKHAALDAWQAIVALPQWTDAPVWTHGDLLPGNLLVRDGRLTAIIDFGGVGVGDPACDMLAAWAVLSANERPIFREHSDVDDATWQRGRGWAFGFGLMAYHYYHVTNPVLAAVGLRSLSESLTEFDA